MRLGWWSGVLPTPALATIVVLVAALGAVEVRAENGTAAKEGDNSGKLSGENVVPFDAQRFGKAYDQVSHGSRPSWGTSQAGEVTSEPSTGLGRILAQVVFSLLLIIGAIYFGSYFLNRFFGKSFLNTTGPLKVLAKKSLSQKNSVYVVGALDRFLIIGESPQGLTCLAEFDDPEENRKLQESWGWEWGVPGEKNKLYTEKTSPFGPTLQSHVSELEQELARIREVSQ